MLAICLSLFLQPSDNPAVCHGTQHTCFQGCLFLQCSHCRPKRGLQSVSLFLTETLHAISVTDTAAETNHAAILELPQHSATLRARECRGYALAFIGCGYLKVGKFIFLD